MSRTEKIALLAVLTLGFAILRHSIAGTEAPWIVYDGIAMVVAALVFIFAGRNANSR